MSAFNTLEKMIKALLKTHPNPTPSIQGIYDNSTDKREKEEIKELACSWGIELDEETIPHDCISNSPFTTRFSRPSFIFEDEILIPFVNSTTEDKIGLESFDMLTGVQFKDIIEKHFKSNGYFVNRISPRINNIDLLIRKEGKLTAVATKHTFDLIQRSYISNVIESAKMYDNISKIIIITTSMYFMPQAQQLADEYGIILWDREKLKINLGGLK